MCKYGKASNQLPYLKKRGLKFVPKSSEKTLSSKDENLCQMIIFFHSQKMKLLIYGVDNCAKGAPVLRAYAENF